MGIGSHTGILGTDHGVGQGERPTERWPGRHGQGSSLSLGKRRIRESLCPRRFGTPWVDFGIRRRHFFGRWSMQKGIGGPIMARSTAPGPATNRGKNGKSVNQDSQTPTLLLRAADAASLCKVSSRTAEPQNRRELSGNQAHMRSHQSRWTMTDDRILVRRSAGHQCARVGSGIGQRRLAGCGR